MTLASLKESLSLLGARGFYAPLFRTSYRHHGVVGLKLGFSLHCHSKRMNPRISEMVPERPYKGDVDVPNKWSSLWPPVLVGKDFCAFPW